MKNHINKPIYLSKHQTRKLGELQLNILRSILSYGEQSKTTANKIIKNSHYPDVSKAFDALASGNKNFIKFSREERRFFTRERGRGQKPEKFYKITVDGLFALLMTNPEPIDFWKVITLLSYKYNISEEDIDRCYYEHETRILGYSSRKGYLIESIKTAFLFKRWYEENYQIGTKITQFKFPEIQIVLECLALNRSVDLEQLTQKTGIPENRLSEILKKISIDCFEDETKKNQLIKVINKEEGEFFTEFSLLIVRSIKNGKSEYELSLFGVMLVLAIITHFYKGEDDIIKKDDFLDLYLVNSDIGYIKYFDLIVTQYKEKLPLIFGKWRLLKEINGTLLYGNFDCIIYENPNNNTFDNSIMGMRYKGNKEYLYDFEIIRKNTQPILETFYLAGNVVLESFIKKDNEIEKSIIHDKIFELQSVRDSLAITDWIKKINYQTQENLPISLSRKLILKLEELFAIEIVLLFYLNLNSFFFPGKPSPIDQFWLIDFMRLGRPNQRLLSTITKDEEIKNWLSQWIYNIIEYRKKTLSKMNSFYDNISSNNPDLVMKKIEQTKKILRGEEKVKKPEYDVSKICI